MCGLDWTPSTCQFEWFAVFECDHFRQGSRVTRALHFNQRVNPPFHLVPYTYCRRAGGYLATPLWPLLSWAVQLQQHFQVQDLVVWRCWLMAGIIYAVVALWVITQQSREINWLQDRACLDCTQVWNSLMPFSLLDLFLLQQCTIGVIHWPQCWALVCILCKCLQCLSPVANFVPKMW